jgi:hypothetical protein
MEPRKMIKVNILNRQNLTLLAKALIDELFIMSDSGNMFYEKNDLNEISYIFFDSVYFSILINDINSLEMRLKISQSNSPNEWFSLIDALNNFEEVENVDFGHLHLYSFGKINYSQIEVSEKQLEYVLNLPFGPINNQNNLFNFIEADLKRAYIGRNIEICRFSEGRGISVNIYFRPESIQKFPFKPIIMILDKYKQEIEDINIFKGQDDNKLYIAVKILGWEN